MPGGYTPAQSPGIPPPATAPADAADAVDPKNPATWGANRENAPEEIQNALRKLVYDFEQENSEARLEQIRKVLQGREFFAGRQIVFWSARDSCYKQPTREQLGDEDYEDLELTTNIYQGYCLILMAELSQAPPRTAFMPEKASRDADVKLAAVGTDIVQFINRNNKIDFKLAYECWLLFNDASYAEYWRFVRDAQKYGVETYQVAEGMTESELAPDRATCPNCGAATPVPSPETAPPICTAPDPQTGQPCSAPMGPATFSPRISEQIPNMVTKTRPAGQEVCDVVGMLELALPAYEKNEEDLGFITWCREVHKARLKAMYPEAADKIGQTVGGETSAAANERTARLSLLAGWPHHGGGRSNLITYRETWLQPWTYHNLEDKDLIATIDVAYPTGAYVAFAGDVYCASRDEDLREHWTITHALPGDGQYRQAMGTSSISSQRKFNQVDSIERDTYERTIPFMIADVDVWDPNALGDQRAKGGDIYGATARGNKTVTNSIYETKPGAVSEQMLVYKEKLMNEVMQHQTGGWPALFGGDTGANDTAHGIATERNAARGRIGLIFRAIKDGRARADLKNVELFRKNRTQDVEIAVAGEATGFKAKTINLEDIKDGSVQIYVGEDESYPVSLNEQKQVVLSLLHDQNPAVMAWFGDPSNEEALGRLLGTMELVRMPGADARSKCFDIIDELLKTPPQMPPPGLMIGAPPPGMPPGAPGAPLPGPPPPPEPTVQPDPILDDLKVFLGTCREWAASDAGREAMIENAGGYENVKAFAQKCLVLLAPPPMPMPMPPLGPGGPHGAAGPPPAPGPMGPEAGAPGPM